MDFTHIAISPRKVYSANTELPDDGLSLLPALQRANQKIYRPESSINYTTQYAEEKLRLIDRCDRLLAATDQGLAGPFGSSEFELSAGTLWQQDLFRSEEIQGLSGLREPLTGDMSDNSIFHKRAWTRPARTFEYRMEETCQELREMSFTNTGFSAHLSAASSSASALTSYVENEETFWNPVRTQSIEQSFPRSLICRHQETRQFQTQKIADHWSLNEVYANGDEEERADNIWSASQGALFHPQQSPKEQPCHISPITSRRRREAERQRTEKHQPDRGRPERQQCDNGRFEQGRYERQQRLTHPRSEQRQDVKQKPFERHRDEMRLYELQRTHGSQSDKRPEFMCPNPTSEASVLDNWKLLLQAFEELNSTMTVEEVEAVEQMEEGRRKPNNHGTDEFFTPGYAGRTKHTLRLGPLPEERRSGKSRNVSVPFQCTVTSPYWEWNSVSPTVSFSNVTITESIQQASDRIALLKWMSEHSRNTLIEHVGRLRELHRRLSNERDIIELLCKPLLEWMSRNNIGDTGKSRAQPKGLNIALAGRERARAQMMSAEHRVRFAG